MSGGKAKHWLMQELETYRFNLKMLAMKLTSASNYSLVALTSAMLTLVLPTNLVTGFTVVDGFKIDLVVISWLLKP